MTDAAARGSTANSYGTLIVLRLRNAFGLPLAFLDELLELALFDGEPGLVELKLRIAVSGIVAIGDVAVHIYVFDELSMRHAARESQHEQGNFQRVLPMDRPAFKVAQLPPIADSPAMTPRYAHCTQSQSRR